MAIGVQAITDAIEQKRIALQREQQRAVSQRNQKLIDQWQAEIDALERVRKRLLEDGGDV
jgi:molecular chaperone GrpE (heat shock protein)